MLLACGTDTNQKLADQLSFRQLVSEPITSTRTFQSNLHPVHKKPPESQLLQTQSTRLVDVNQDLFSLHQIVVDPVEWLVLKVCAILEGKKKKKSHIINGG